METDALIQVRPEDDVTTVYKIRRFDGLFSTGGRYPEFTKKGKTWKRYGDLKHHLSICGFTGDATRHHAYNGCDLVSFCQVMMETGKKTMYKTAQEMKQQKQEKEAEEKQRRVRAEQQEELQTLRKLAKKYDFKIVVNSPGSK